MNKILSLVRRCVEDYDMIQAGDRVAVGVSGGKDSLTLLAALARLREFYPRPFTVEPTEINRIIFELRKEKNPCSMCAKMRRGALHNAMAERGLTKIALGHHHDDAVETFFMSLIFEGRLSCFQPVTFLDRTGITQIRPLLYCSESMIAHTAQRLAFPVVHNPCPADGATRRQEMKELVYELNGRYPGLKNRVFGAMQRLPLPTWAPADPGRRPPTEEAPL